MSNPIVIPCATEEAWHAERAKGIGGSEAEILFGLSRYEDKTPAQLWAQKKLDAPPAIDPQKKDRLEAGHFLEPANAAWFAQRWDRHLATPQEYYGCSGAFAVIVAHPELPWLRCTPDRIQWRGRGNVPGILQLKNVDRFLLREWEDEDEEVAPPLRVQIQVQHEMLCTGLSWGSIAAIVGGNRRRDADVERHEAFQGTLIQKLGAFWSSLQGDVPPPLTGLDLARIRATFPGAVEGKSVELSRPELVLELARINAQKSALESEADRLKAELLAELGDAELAECHGKRMFTCKVQHRETYVVEAKDMRVLRLDPRITKLAKETPDYGYGTRPTTPVLPAG